MLQKNFGVLSWDKRNFSIEIDLFKIQIKYNKFKYFLKKNYLIVEERGIWIIISLLERLKYQLS